MSYSHHEGTDAHATGANRYCGRCGAHVSTAFARVFGDNDNDVYGCPDCTTMRELRNGTAGTS